MIQKYSLLIHEACKQWVAVHVFEQEQTFYHMTYSRYFKMRNLFVPSFSFLYLYSSAFQIFTGDLSSCSDHRVYRRECWEYDHDISPRPLHVFFRAALTASESSSFGSGNGSNFGSRTYAILRTVSRKKSFPFHLVKSVSSNWASWTFGSRKYVIFFLVSNSPLQKLKR